MNGKKSKVDIKTGLNSNIDKIEERMKKLEDISEETTLNTRREVRGERFARHIKR